MTLTEFLLARIAEDEAAARLAIPPRWDDAESTPHWRHDGNPSGAFMAGQMVIGQASSWREVDQDGGRFARHIVRWDPARVLAECEAKRRIIEWASSEGMPNPDSEYSRGWLTAGYFILRSLAAAYADHPDHPDYDQAWAFTT
jgi:hypothetical protein